MPRVITGSHGARCEVRGCLALWVAACAVAGAATPPAPLKMTVADVVATALSSSRAIRDARLSRSSDLLDLRLAARQFLPFLDLGAAANRAQTQTYPNAGVATSVSADAASAQAVLREAIPTGGQVAFTWDAASASSDGSGALPLNADHKGAWQVALVQPLLRGGGVDVGTADLHIARLNDRKSALALAQQVMAVITSGILAFHDLARAGEELEIARSSLAEARRLAEMSQALIDAGRMAPVDLVQTETDVANKQVDVVVAENRLDAARLALVQVLDVPVGTVIEPVASPQPAVPAPELATVQALALERRPEVLSAHLDLEIARTTLTVSGNERLPQLDLAAGYGGTADHPALLYSAFHDRGWSTGLTLGYTVGDTERAVRHGQAKIAVERSELAIRELEATVQLDVAGRVRDLRNAALAADLAKRARELSEKQLEVEGEKLKVGRSSNFEYLRLQNDLVAARQAELAASVSYLDALTLLDQALGTTLDTWGISVELAGSEAK
jgi:outer membrane protein TolC